MDWAAMIELAACNMGLLRPRLGQTARDTNIDKKYPMTYNKY